MDETTSRSTRAVSVCVLLGVAGVGTVAIGAWLVGAHALAVILAWVVGVFYPPAAAPTPLGPAGAVAITSIASVGLVFRLADSQLSGLETTPAEEASVPAGVDVGELQAMTTRLAATFDVPRPTVLIAETDSALALATGVRRGRTRVVLSRGLLSELDPDELAAVVAHELAHVSNGDSRVMTVAAIPVVAMTELLELFGAKPDGTPRSSMDDTATGDAGDTAADDPPSGPLTEAGVFAIGGGVLAGVGLTLLLSIGGTVAGTAGGLLLGVGEFLAIVALMIGLPLRGTPNRGFEHSTLADVTVQLSVAGVLAFDALLASDAGLVPLAALLAAGAVLLAVIVSVILLTYVPWLLWVMTNGLAAALGRHREFAADRGAALATGDPGALETALQTLGDGRQPRPETDLRVAAVEPLSIVPLSEEPQTWGRHPALQRRLFRSHPSTGRRVDRLRELERALETE